MMESTLTTDLTTEERPGVLGIFPEPVATHSSDAPPSPQAPPLSTEFETRDGWRRVQPSPTGGLEAPRVLGVVEGREAGPCLIIVAGIHGNEPAGVLGSVRLLRALEEHAVGLPRGRLVALVGNRQALALGRRFVQHDLNRHWQPQRVADLQRRAASADPSLADEDLELVELSAAIDAQRQQFSTEGVFLLDLHTFSAPGIAFSTLDDNLRNRAFTLQLPVPAVLGLEEELSGTLASFTTFQGVVSAGYESGQHESPQAVDRALAALWIAMSSAGLASAEEMPEIDAARRRLTLECAHLPTIVEVRCRHHIEPQDAFAMDPGWGSFEPVRKGQRLARDHRGAVAAPMNALVLMPLYQKLGSDGFFLARPVHWRWLWLSALVRRLPVVKVLHWLPGVRRHPEVPEAYRVDRRTARFGVLDLFHLLGFERRSALSERWMTWARRDARPEPPAS